MEKEVKDLKNKIKQVYEKVINKVENIKEEFNYERSAGILMHPISLPGNYGIGTLGKESFEFVDFLTKAKQSLWQMFPLGPTGYGDSPYQCFSAFAGNPYLIDLEELVRMNLLSLEQIEPMKTNDPFVIDYGKLYEVKNSILFSAYENMNSYKHEFEMFKEDNKKWLDDYALFMALKTYFNGKPWDMWEDSIRKREEEALKKYSSKLEKEIDIQKFLQFLFFYQYDKLKRYANSKGIKIIGDIPIFVSFDSADAWANKDIFLFDNDLKPCSVAGVPPDYFSETGQLWGNPLYNWEKLKKDDYKFWKDRIEANLKVCDIIRIDHFRGFASYWEIPYGSETAINGTWKQGPGKDFFDSLKKEFGNLEIIAEDLGILTDDVVELKKQTKLPGMKILQFAFDKDPKNEYLPHNYEQNCVVYTGTHDNDTTYGWYTALSDEQKGEIRDYLDINNDDAIVWSLIRQAHRSVAKYSIIPMQDYVCYGSNARMNTPGLASGNWTWRIEKSKLNDELAEAIGHITKIYGR